VRTCASAAVANQAPKISWADLYGNDDDGIAPAQPDIGAGDELEDYPDEIPPAPSHSTIPGSTSGPHSMQLAPKPQVTQPIQTYQQGDTSAPPVRVIPGPLPTIPPPMPRSPALGGDTAHIPVGERSVRPSEMKDEG
jgi:hypothetical protein